MTTCALLLAATAALSLLYRVLRHLKDPPAATGSSSLLTGRVVSFWAATPSDRALPAHIDRFTSPAGHRYGFTFVQLTDGRCRAYIREQPAYGTHRYRDPRGRLYVCFQPEPQEPDQLLTVAGYWIAGTDSYLRTGKFLIPKQPRSEHA